MARHSRHSSLIAALLILGAVPGFAAEHYSIDPEHTSSIFEYSHWGWSAQRGRFDRTTGFIDLDQEQKAGAIDIEIETASITAGNGFFNSILRSPDFFDAAHYPKIVFKSTQLHFDENRLTQVEGDLTIKNITRHTTLELTEFNCRTSAEDKRICNANGYTRIRRSEFNLNGYSPFVRDGVTIFVFVEAIRDDSRPISTPATPSLPPSPPPSSSPAPGSVGEP